MTKKGKRVIFVSGQGWEWLCVGGGCGVVVCGCNFYWVLEIVSNSECAQAIASTFDWVQAIASNFD